MTRPLAIVALILLSPAAAAAQAAADASAEFRPHRMPTLEVRRAAGPIDVDGELDDAGWRGAARATRFAEFQPGDGVRPPVETEALVTYDDDHLYVAFIAHDDPARIRASLTDRDRAFGDDFVAVLL
ncbi:MAG: hypothetical protein GWN71_02165, partial [Gammaproteobacteria bacterium]|nr:hypothetical protein [Gemmatimonadota bacterium]NIU72416.1 hypothetical protein [Gammaproteobacteria bacterium]